MPWSVLRTIVTVRQPILPSGSPGCPPVALHTYVSGGFGPAFEEFDQRIMGDALDRARDSENQPPNNGRFATD
jgi:hypothetical protein